LSWLTGRAALVSPSARLTQQAQRLDELEQRLSRGLRRQLQELNARLRWLTGRTAVVGPAIRLTQLALRLGSLEQRLQRASREALRRARDRLLPLVRTLNAVSPLATLERGYAIVSTADGRILRDAGTVPPGTTIEARLGKGRLRAKVEGCC
jgi:exodeoxyribonuclease VII large subunit